MCSAEDKLYILKLIEVLTHLQLNIMGLEKQQ